MDNLDTLSEEQKADFKKKLSQYDYVRFTICDIVGMCRNKTVPGRRAAGYVDNGMQVWAGEYGSLQARHDP